MSVSVASCGLSYASPSTVGGTGTGILIFPSLLNANEPAIVSIPTTLAGTRIEIVASGNLYVSGTTPHVGFALQAGNSLVSSDNVSICAAANSTQALTTDNYYPFTLSVFVSGDADSGTIQVEPGTFTVGGNVVSNTVTQLPAGSPPQTPAWNGPGAAIQLVFGITFGTSDADNAAQLQQFEAFA